MKLKKSKEIGAVIPTASMADIAFLLIIFFMVTTVMQVDKTTVNLPRTWERPFELPRGAAFVVLGEMVSGSGGKELVYKFSAGEDTSQIIPTGAEGLYFEVLNITGIAPTHPFVIKIDRTMKYKLVDEILDSMRRAGAQNLILMSDQRTVGG
jgi:biopolymer transport protein ExbD